MAVLSVKRNGMIQFKILINSTRKWWFLQSGWEEKGKEYDRNEFVQIKKKKSLLLKIVFQQKISSKLT